MQCSSGGGRRCGVNFGAGVAAGATRNALVSLCGMSDAHGEHRSCAPSMLAFASVATGDQIEAFG